MIATDPSITRDNSFTWTHALIWLTLSVSCIVFVEPAPYDALVILLIVSLFPLGLRVPREAGVAVFLLALFTAGNLIGALTFGDPQLTVRPLITRIYMVLTWVLFVSVIANDPKTMIKYIWRGYTIAALIAAVWGSLEYYDLLPEVAEGDAFGRAKGPFKDANVFGPFLVPIVLHTVSVMLRSNGMALALELSKFLVIAFGLLLSFSRGAWINLGFAFSLYMLLSIATAPTLRQKIRLVTLVVFLSLTAGLSLSWAVNNTAAGEMFFNRARLVKEYDVETGGRFYTQGLVVHELGRRPLGIGPGMAPSVFGLAPHNLYLHTAIEGGWIAGVSINLFFLLSIIRALARAGFRWNLQSDLHVVVAAVMGTLFQSFFVDSTHWRHLWLLLAMVWGLTVACDRDRSYSRNDVMLKGG